MCNRKYEMNISVVSKKTGLSTKTIRYYEDINIVKPARSENGYRKFSATDLHQLAFVQRSRSLGFTIEECKLLLSLYKDNKRASSDVKKLALNKIRQIEQKIKEMKCLKSTLANLAKNCHGDNKPDCPIIDDLAGHTKIKSAV